MADRVYTVTEINREVKQYIEENPFFQNFFVKGEMSNITYYRSGHLYFTLKDEKAAVKCTIFHYKMKRVPEDLKEGDSVKIFGRASLYEATGQYQIIADFLEKESSIGKLYEQLEKLKRELAEKGYFDAERKKELPYLPLTIGVVTSESGAALRDIINTAKKRFPGINIYLYPAKVQGEGAEDEIAQGIKVLNKIEAVDLIVIGRGGGSIEDLWAFNSKKVAEAVFKSKKPIISAVGHETDVLLSDFVADVRAATPTQAIEISVRERKAVKELFLDKKERAERAVKMKLENSMAEIESRKNEYIIKRFPDTIEEKGNRLVEYEERAVRALKHGIGIKKEVLNSKRGKLNALNPQGILKRGYTITRKSGKNIKSAADIRSGDRIETIFFEGSVESIVK